MSAGKPDEQPDEGLADEDAGRDLPFVPTHQHYKGGMYQKVADALHSETEEPLVIYRSSDGRWWARPKQMFDEVWRFKPLSE